MRGLDARAVLILAVAALAAGCGGGSGGGGGDGTVPAPEVLAYEPGAPVSAIPATPFTVLGTGFGPVGGDAEVTFTAVSGGFCGDGEAVSVIGQITSETAIEGMTPGGGVSGALDAVVTVVLPGDVVPLGSASAQFLPPPGTGLFVDTVAGLNGDHVTTLSLGDVNGDGHLDIVAANGGSGTAKNVAVFVGDGSGGFDPAGTFAPSAGRATLGDLDGDHDLDAVVVYYEALLPNVWMNDGTGAFAAFGASLGSFKSQAVHLADLDGDQDLDILLGMATGGGNRTFVNDGTGTFSPGATFTTAGSTFSVATADVDGDQDLDVFAGSDATLPLFLNDGSGGLTPSPHPFANLSTTVKDIVAGDVDGDGDPDVVVVSFTHGTVWVNDGAGVFAVTGQLLGDTTAFVTLARGGVLGDIDGDCDLDLVLANAPGFNTAPGSFDGRETVWTNAGDGTFSDSGQRLGTNGKGESTYGLALGDLDGDGDLDLVTADGFNFRIDVYENQ